MLKRLASQRSSIFSAAPISGLRSLHTVARQAGVIKICVGTTEFDFFDALRAEINLRNGEALANLSLAQAILDRFTEGQICVDEGQTSMPVSAAARYLENGDAGRLKPRSQTSRLFSAFRSQAYQIKHEVSLLRWPQSFLAGINCRSGSPLMLAVRGCSGIWLAFCRFARKLRDNYSVETVFAVTGQVIELPVRKEGFQVLQLAEAASGNWNFNLSHRREVLSWLKELLGSRKVNRWERQFSRAERRILAEVTQQTLSRNFNYALRVTSAVERLISP